MWTLPRPGIGSVSPALAGGFSATGPPGKSREIPLIVSDGLKVTPQSALPGLLRAETRRKRGSHLHPLAGKDPFFNKKEKYFMTVSWIRQCIIIIPPKLGTLNNEYETFPPNPRLRWSCREIQTYWVGQKVHLDFSVTSHRKTWMNLLANPTYVHIHPCTHTPNV